MTEYDKIVIVTRKTRLQELIERFHTQGQAKFVIESAGGDFADYLREHDAYRRSLELVRGAAEVGLKVQMLERGLVPTYLFTDKDVVVTAGPDGLVANVAKYVGEQPLLAVNMDATREDGVLLPFVPQEAAAAMQAVLAGKCRVREVTLAQALLNDGQKLLAFNDLFIGARSHISARYAIRWQGRVERQSSSGVIVSTGAGSTGWLSSVFNMVAGVAAFMGQKVEAGRTIPWEDPRLMFVVREPFRSKHSEAGLVAGTVAEGQSLQLESLMPSGGVIFSDGIEADFLEFNSAAVASIGAAPRRARLVVK